MMKSMVKKAIRLFLASEMLIFTTMLISFSFFINLQIAFLSSLFVILGSSYSYKKMVKQQLDSNSYEEKRDLLDEIEDPYELYDENEMPLEEELDLKQIVKEEKAKIKTLNKDTLKHSTRGTFSLMRVIPYIFLALGFIALKNNELLELSIYLPSLLIGIVTGSIMARDIF